ncbi:MAG: single-stranded DNA-binding protein [Bacteroidales bacterium]|nr:single-stranded DNA-binding protein [Bacteroidales bacterium]
MAGVNRVILVGNLGKDPEIMTFENGVKRAAISVATTESYKDKEGNWVDQTEWHNVVLWRWLAEKNLIKGDTVYIEGKLKTRSWDDKDGNKRYTTEVVADKITRLISRKDQAGSFGSPPPPTEAPEYFPERQTTHDQQSSASVDRVNEEPSDDLPF